MSTLLIILSVVVSVILGIVTNILSGLVQPDMMRWRKTIISVLVFLLVLAICISILQSETESSQASETPYINHVVEVNDISLLSGAIRKEWNGIYLDNFSEDTLNLWRFPAIPNETTVYPTIENGSFEIKVTTTEWAYQEVFFRSFWGGSDDFEISVEAALVAKSGCGFGVAFRGDPSGNYYVFGLQSNENYETDIRYFITEVTPALEQKRRVLMSRPLSEVVGIPQSLKVISIQNDFFFFVNDRMVDYLNQEQGKRTIRGSGFGLEVLVCPGMSETFVFENFLLYVPLEADNKIKINDLEKVIPTNYPHPSPFGKTPVQQNYELINKINKHELLTENYDSSFLSLIPQPSSVTDFKISGRFHNPSEGETSNWSYGFFLHFKNGDIMNALVRSDSLWAIAYYENRSGKYTYTDFGILNNLNFGYKASNDLELIAFQNQVKFTVNGIEIFDGVNSLSNSSISDIGVAVALDDERDRNYSVLIENTKLWKIP